MKINQSRISPLYRSEWAEEFEQSASSARVREPSGQLTPIEFSEAVSTEDSKKPLNRTDAAGVHQAGCYLCSTWPKTFAFVATLGLLCATIIILPIVLTNVLGAGIRTTSTTSTTSTSTSSTTTTTTTTTSQTTTTTTSSTSTSTTTRAVCTVGCANTSTSTNARIAFYQFDGTAADTTGSYSASTIGSPTYITGFIHSAILFDSSFSQSLSAPAMALNSRSFTIEFWFYCYTTIGYYHAVFGQLSVIGTTRQTLFVVLNNGRWHFGFFNDDSHSVRTLAANTWYHIALVYNNDLRQRLIYIDGVIDMQSATGVGPYLGTSGAITIGAATIYGAYGGTVYSNVVLDHLTVSTRAKSACEILNDATLAVYLPFDGNLIDAGPNFLSPTAAPISYMTGVVGQAYYFSGSSYVRIPSLTSLGRNNYPFSIAFWVNPTVYGALVHVTTDINGLGWCVPFIGISSSGNIISNVFSASPSVLVGPVLQMNVWTHVIQSYSPTNGHKLYINGQLVAASPSVIFYTASGVQNFILLGHRLNSVGACYNPGILDSPLQGGIDEFRVYSRELSIDDVCLLAWP